MKTVNPYSQGLEKGTVSKQVINEHQRTVRTGKGVRDGGHQGDCSALPGRVTESFF